MSPARVLLIVSLLTAAPAPAAAAPARSPLQTTIDRQLSHSPSVPGIAARVDAPGLHWAGAAGGIDRAGTRELSPGNSFRIASVTKTFTAAAVLALADRRLVDVDAPISRYLPGSYRTQLRRGGYRPESISVRQLLDHTSGIYDFGTDQDYVQTAIQNLRHRWTATEQIAWAMQHGRPYAPPGREWHYSDTGYVLLARIVESVTGLPQAAAYRDLLRFERIGLTSTWFESLEPAPRTAGPRAHQYFIYPPAGLDIDFYPADPSYDLYGGGGLVSTVADLNRFFRALVEGRIIGRTSLRTMLSLRPSDYGPAGMGIFATSVGRTTCWWNEGFIGVVALYCPERRLAVSLTVNASLNGSDNPHAFTDAVELTTTALALITHNH